MIALRCSECDHALDLDASRCSACGGLPAFVLDPSAFRAADIRERAQERRASIDPRDRSGVWRFRELLPPIAEDAIVTLREGDVPLYDAPRGAEYAGVTHWRICISG